MNEQLDQGAIGRVGLRGITPYQTDRTRCLIDTSHNTNLWGAPPSALAAVRDAESALLAEYPGLESKAVREAIAAYGNVPADHVMVGCGSDDLLDGTFLGLLEPGERVAFPVPTFSMIPVFAKMTGIVGVPVPLASDYDIDVDALLATTAPLIYIAAPNNPTGVPVAHERVERLLDEAPGFVLIDEAYAEFADGRWMERTATHDRLVVVRTMSKAWGMAGLRFGYGAAQPALRRQIERARGPYTVNAVAEHAALAALTHDVAWVRRVTAEATDVRERFAEALRGMELSPLPSATNFLYVPIENAAAIAERMERDYDIRVRAFPRVHALGEGLRIGVAPWSLMTRVIDALYATMSVEIAR